ncbi:MAG TPA: hypothetical protein VM049_08465 [Gaiellaceae bacterium]|nr:hypothetical protein [Gaiellaceae bacterium]
MLHLRVRDGELVSEEAWVYAWAGADGVVYVGATALHPATRTWLHLHDDDPDVGRMRARYADLAKVELDVLAHQLPAGVDRQQVRHGAVAAFGERGLLSARHVCDPPLAAAPHPETDAFVAAVAERLDA